LRKRTLNGDLYERDPKVEALLVELSALPRDDLIERASISARADSRYVPSECLIYFIRASRSENGEAWFGRLYRILAERVLRCLPKPDSPDGETTSLTREVIRDKVFGRFVELLSADRDAYAEKLDYFEIRFDGALANLRRDAQEKAWRDENRSKPLEYDDESGELSAEVEEAAGAYDPFATSDFDDANYRLRLEAAIDALPPEQSRIIHMLRQGFPIDSKEPGVMTIAKALGRSEKTVRTYRDKAFATVRAAMSNGEGR
jgi:DNA-binding CsgD family transcriptional regulator